MGVEIGVLERQSDNVLELKTCDPAIPLHTPHTQTGTKKGLSCAQRDIPQNFQSDIPHDDKKSEAA